MRCPHCLGRIDDDPEFCPHCKKRLRLELTPELKAVNKRCIVASLAVGLLIILGSGIMFSGVLPGDVSVTLAGRRFIEILGAAHVCAGIAASVNLLLAREELTDKKDLFVGRAAGWIILALLLIIASDIACTDDNGLMSAFRYPMVYVSLVLHILVLIMLLRLRDRTRLAVGKVKPDSDEETAEADEAKQ